MNIVLLKDGADVLVHRLDYRRKGDFSFLFEEITQFLMVAKCRT